MQQRIWGCFMPMGHIGGGSLECCGGQITGSLRCCGDRLGWASGCCEVPRVLWRGSVTALHDGRCPQCDDGDTSGAAAGDGGAGGAGGTRVDHCHGGHPHGAGLSPQAPRALQGRSVTEPCRGHVGHHHHQGMSPPPPPPPSPPYRSLPPPASGSVAHEAQPYMRCWRISTELVGPRGGWPPWSL